MKRNFALLLLLAVFMVSCDRRPEPYGGVKNAPEGAPKYDGQDSKDPPAAIK